MSAELLEILRLANAALQALRALGISRDLLAAKLASGEPLTVEDIRKELIADDIARERIENAARNQGV